MKLIQFPLTILVSSTVLLWGFSPSLPSIMAQPLELENESRDNPLIIFNRPDAPDRGSPREGVGEGSGTYGLCSRDETTTAFLPLSALVLENPEQYEVWATTTSARPTLWFYVPYEAGAWVEFILQDEQGKQVHDPIRFQLQQTPGIVGLKLPDTVTLDRGQLYHWFFKIKCDIEESTDDYVEGWLEHYPPLEQPLDDLTALERAQLYADEGVLLETLTELGRLYYANPNDAAIASYWQQLLEQIDRSHLTQEPIVEILGD
ncbi:DUF928 domain-containing protein [Spirulina sp. CS-785/01]|uniref:DUF928 domain-containing protein n=1 Tax=Spirulina sp. CS-785/01 TaxID=3021716 RepID=UPI0023315A1F|nr:DUF928 domain-containing protein [Spirulina sp. CS-785/01]MDB9313634.1 DUF928 domain-containing protein [Spirulina sp. CS-785/01]